MRKLILAAALAAAAPCWAQGFELKGFALGIPMSHCPPGTIDSRVVSGEMVCVLGPTTLANQEATAVLLGYFEGKISSVAIRMKASGRGANADLRDAISARYGKPTGGRDHVGEYIWGNGKEQIRLDAWRGVVILDEPALQARIRAEAAKANKKDL
jgi:hypothetical protein